MVQAVVYARGKTQIVFMDTNMNANEYACMLSKHSIPVLEDKYIN